MLRPLRIGEIFDRAVTLCVTNFVPFALIALFYVVPLAVAGIFQQRDTAQSWQALLDAARGHAPAATRVPATNWALGLCVFSYVLIAAPFVHMGIAAAIAQRYAGQPVEWRSAFAAALRRWGAVLGMLFFALVMLVAAVLGGSLALGIIAGLTAVMLTAAKVVAIAFAIVAVLLFIAWLLLLMVLSIALFFMFFGLVVERAPLFTAIGSGFARVFNRKELLRALTMGLAFFAMEMGLTVVTYAIIGVVDIWLHAFVAGALVLSVVNLIAVLLSATLFTVYYFDVRIRSEALDMQQPNVPFVPVTQT